MGGAVLSRHEPLVVIIKWGNHKHDEYNVDRGSGMADLKLQTAQRVVSNQCLLSTSHYDLVLTRKVQ